MDKLAQKFSAQEMINANSQAEAEEMKRLQMQVSEYEKILQEMRKLSYKNTELSERLELVIGEKEKKIQRMKEDEKKLIAVLKDLTEEQTKNRDSELEKKEEERLEKERVKKKKKQSDISVITNLLENKFQRSDDFVHKENVKVYRNVQAVVVDELKRYTESAQEEKNAINAKLGKVMKFSVISMLASIVSVVLWALMAAGIIK